MFRTSCIISSAVEITLLFAWKFRCEVIRLMTSVAMSVVDDSSVLAEIVPRPPVPDATSNVPVLKAAFSFAATHGIGMLMANGYMTRYGMERFNREELREQLTSMLIAAVLSGTKLAD